MKSYGRVDSSWDRARVRSVLEDALYMAVKHDTSVYVGEDVDGNIVALSNQDGGRGRIHILACWIAEAAGDPQNGKARADIYWLSEEYEAHEGRPSDGLDHFRSGRSKKHEVHERRSESEDAEEDWVKVDNLFMFMRCFKASDFSGGMTVKSMVNMLGMWSGPIQDVQMTPEQIVQHWIDSGIIVKTGQEKSKEFWDHAAYHRYTIDEVTPRVHDCLVNGIVRYGGLQFLSEGQSQLARVFEDARKMVERHGRPFIMGLSKKHDIMIAPVSEKSEFVAPLSCVITKSDIWSVSDMHSDIIWEGRDEMVIRPTYFSGVRHNRRVALDMLHGGIAQCAKYYGSVEDDQDRCISNLESAFEDAVNMPNSPYGSCCVVLNGDRITMRSKKEMTEWAGCRFWEADPKEFLDGCRLLRERISAAARDAYEDIRYG